MSLDRCPHGLDCEDPREDHSTYISSVMARSTHHKRVGDYNLHHWKRLWLTFESLCFTLAGCYDGKVSSLAMTQRLEAHVINGPPDTADMPPFHWAEPWASQLSHLGQPATFNFKWQHLKPAL